MTLFWLAAAWLAGVAATSVTDLVAWQWLSLAGLALTALILFRQERSYRLLFGLLLMLFLGAARGSAAERPPGPAHVSHYNDLGEPATLVGLVVDFPDVRQRYVGLRLRVEGLQGQDGSLTPAEGLVLVRAPRFGDYAYGDRIRTRGYLETPPEMEGFSYRTYLARRGIHSILAEATIVRLEGRQANPLLQALFDYRRHALRVLHRLFPEPEASLLAGILLGVESGIPPEVRQAFNDSGTSHIIAISGFNLTLIASFVIALFGRWLGARRGALAAGLAIGLYTLLVGAEAAVVRAAVMAGLALLARRLGRQSDGLASLGAAALIMTAVNPRTMWDVGFQLSFAATLGLVLYATPLQERFEALASRRLGREAAHGLAGPVGEFVLFTLAAQLITLPLMAYYFGRLSLVSWVANPVVLPLQPPLMALAGPAVLAGSLWTPLGQPLAWLAWPFAALTVRASIFFASLPNATLPLGRVGLPAVAGFYLLLIAFKARPHLPAAPRPALPELRVPTTLGLIALLLATGLTWRAAAERPDGLLHVIFLDVGGEATLIETPGGRFILINGGPSPVALTEALGSRLPLFGRALDWVIVASDREEQIAGLTAAVEDYPLGALLVAAEGEGSAYRHVIQAVEASGRPIVQARTGYVLDLGDGARLQVLALGRRGALLLLTHGRARILLAPGLDTRLAEALMRRQPPGAVQAMLLADGGGLWRNPPAWLEAVRPRLAVASIGGGRGADLPAPEVASALAGAKLLRTDRNGWIELITDGDGMWVEVERLPASPLE